MNIAQPNSKKIYHSFIMLMLCIWICSISSCSLGSSAIVNYGIVSGKVTIGPLCPVESIPPNPNCVATQDTYNAWPIAIWTVDKKTKIGQIQPNATGEYVFDLLEGNYIIDLDKPHQFGSNLPATIKIESNEILIFHIDIDTGIR